MSTMSMFMAKNMTMPSAMYANTHVHVHVRVHAHAHVPCPCPCPMSDVRCPMSDVPTCVCVTTASGLTQWKCMIEWPGNWQATSGSSLHRSSPQTCGGWAASQGTLPASVPSELDSLTTAMAMLPRRALLG
jgi:hypothetical protein